MAQNTIPANVAQTVIVASEAMYHALVKMYQTSAEHSYFTADFLDVAGQSDYARERKNEALSIKKAHDLLISLHGRYAHDMPPLDFWGKVHEECALYASDCHRYHEHLEEDTYLSLLAMVQHVIARLETLVNRVA